MSTNALSVHGLQDGIAISAQTKPDESARSLRMLRQITMQVRSDCSYETRFTQLTSDQRNRLWELQGNLLKQDTSDQNAPREVQSEFDEMLSLLQITPAMIEELLSDGDREVE
ncbi:hypothetical protein KKC44_03545 [Patescibacteria group bacterium]|nr:hypothetical protein [Patescibacteria group bacterium]MBU2259658.1 hypothetical protein [Patescibacteria group bacterium]